jgi:hypothetical protein
VLAIARNFILKGEEAVGGELEEKGRADVKLKRTRLVLSCC